MLRISRITATTAAGALALTAALSASLSAQAETALIDGVVLENDADWDMEAYETSNVLDGPTISIDEGDLGDQTDGLDGAFEFAVGGETFVAEENGNLTGPRQLIVGPKRVGGLRTTATYRALDNSATIRLLITLKNTTRKSLARTVEFGSDMGSDSSTTIATTSSGNKKFTTADRWVISADDLANPSDPVVTQVYGGPGGAGLTAATHPSDDVELFTAKMRVKVPGRSTRHLMLFINLDPVVGDAKKAVKAFNDANLSASLLSGISKATRKKVLNWDL